MAIQGSTGFAVDTVLSIPLSATSLTFYIANTLNWPVGERGNFVVFIDGEQVLCSKRDGSRVTAVSRGYAGTTAAAHTTSSTVSAYSYVTDLPTTLTSTTLTAYPTPAPTIASAATIAPVSPAVFVSGTTNIVTITPPSPISLTGGQITLIPTGLWATTTAGNIALATTAVVSKALELIYDSVTGKWYPTY